MSEITRVGADLAKRVIQVHAVDAAGKLVTNRALPRDKFIAWCAQLPVPRRDPGTRHHALRGWPAHISLSRQQHRQAHDAKVIRK